MRQLLFIGPSLRGGGLERVMSTLANEAADYNAFKVTIILMNKADIFYRISDRINVVGLENKTLLKLPIVRYLVFTFLILRYMSQTSFVRIISFGETYNSLSIFCGLLTNSEVVVSNRASPSTDKKVRRLVNKFFYKYAKVVIVQTKYAKNVLSNVFNRSKLIVVPNPIADQPCSVERNNIILNVGSLSGLKNQSQLIEMFAEINSNDWCLYIVGGGSKEVVLKELVTSLELTNKVIFTGAVKDVQSLYNKAKIFAFTSLSEGFPNVLLEAMNAGCAVISYDCIAGPSEMIEDGFNGNLVDLGDTTTYKEKLHLLMKDDKTLKRFSNNAKISARKFSPKVILDCFISLTDFYENYD